MFGAHAMQSSANAVLFQLLDLLQLRRRGGKKPKWIFHCDRSNVRALVSYPEAIEAEARVPQMVASNVWYSAAWKIQYKRRHLETHKLSNLVRIERATEFAIPALCSSKQSNLLQFPADSVCACRINCSLENCSPVHVACCNRWSTLHFFFVSTLSLVRLRSHSSSHANVFSINFLYFHLRFS